VVRAYAPYAIVIAVFSIAQIPAVKDALAESPWTTTFQWPGLDVASPDGEAISSLTFNLKWLPATGTLMAISGLITMAVLGVSPGRAMAPVATRSRSWRRPTVILMDERATPGNEPMPRPERRNPTAIERWYPLREAISLCDAMSTPFQESFIRPSSLVAQDDLTSFPLDISETE